MFLPFRETTEKTMPKRMPKTYCRRRASPPHPKPLGHFSEADILVGGWFWPKAIQGEILAESWRHWRYLPKLTRNSDEPVLHGISLPGSTDIGLCLGTRRPGGSADWWKWFRWLVKALQSSQEAWTIPDCVNDYDLTVAIWNQSPKSFPRHYYFSFWKTLQSKS